MNRKVRSSLFAAALIPATFLMAASCSYPNPFVNIPQATPHAVVEAEKPTHFFTDSLTIVAINGRPTSFWRSAERFRIPEGRTTLGVILSSRSARSGYRPCGDMTFDARPGDRFLLRREHPVGADRVAVIRSRGGQPDQQVAGTSIERD